MTFRGAQLLLTLALVTISFQSLFAQQEAIIFEVKKNLALRDSDKIIKDYLISQGTEAGLQPGTVVTVNRRVSVYDNYQNRTAGDMMIPVGEMQIIFSQKGLAVGRLLSIYDRRNLPSVDYESLMIGDRLDLRSLRKGKVSANDFESREDTLQMRRDNNERSASNSPTPEQKEATEPTKETAKAPVSATVDLNASVSAAQIKADTALPKPGQTDLSSLTSADVSSPN
jgi:hypothetical protein